MRERERERDGRRQSQREGDEEEQWDIIINRRLRHIKENTESYRHRRKISERERERDVLFGLRGHVGGVEWKEAGPGEGVAGDSRRRIRGCSSQSRPSPILYSRNMPLPGTEEEFRSWAGQLRADQPGAVAETSRRHDIPST